MRASLAARKQLLLALMFLGVASPALGEQLLMPFRCEVRGGELRLSSAPEQAYDIIGPRQRHVFSVCSPTNHSKCRNWQIHRFDVDCAGRRVPWIDIVDAAARFHRSRAWVEGGQMHLEMSPLWAIERDEPYGAPTWRERRERYRGRLPYGDGEDAGAREVVDLPPGFAPTLGLPVTFVGPEGESGSFNAVEGPPPAPGYDDFDREPAGEGERRFGAIEEPYGEGGRERLPPVRELPRQTVEVERPAAPKPAPPPPAPVPAKRVEAPAKDKAAGETPAPQPQKQAPVATERSSPATPVKTPDGAAPAPAPASDTPKASGGLAAGPGVGAPAGTSGPIVPTIINSSKPKAAEALSSERASKAAEQQVAAADQSAKSETSVSSLELAIPVGNAEERSSVLQSGLAWLLYGAAVLAALGSGAYLLFGAKGSRQAGVSEGWQRDFSRVNLGGGRASTAVVPVPTPATAVVAAVAEGERPAQDLKVPATMEEALAVLGASADAAIEVVKKIVDGLRQSWHPDLAKSEADRLYREKRMAQINVAWDIVQAHRRAHT